MNVNRLKECMQRNHVTQKELAKTLGMSESTFGRRLKNGSFGLVEANLMIEALHIDDPEDIFFAPQLT